MQGQQQPSNSWEARLNAIRDILQTSHTEEELVEANALLNEMKIILKRQKQIDKPPKKKPPKNDAYPEIVTPPRSLIPSQAVSSLSASKNPFAYFRELMDDQDSSDDDDDEDDASSTEEEEDHTSTNSPLADTPFPLRAPPELDVRRLLIRIYDAQSSMHAALAVHCRKRFAWLDGAEHFRMCIALIQEGLVLADTAITKFLVQRNDPVRLKLLQEDASIIEVAVQSMARNRDAYIKSAQQQANYLIRQLTPQWKSRDDVKKRMGDRWFQNPHPRRDYVKLRAEMEEKLKIVNAALEALQSMDITTIQGDSKGLLRKLSKGDNATMDQDRRRRYNGQRPFNTSNRVSWDDYPDATEFGWTFTGSHEVTEFFEREDIKLDWYFTTATVKTSLDHPKQGKTQLFASKVSPEVYLQILLEPRAHTGQRYHTTKNK